MVKPKSLFLDSVLGQALIHEPVLGKARGFILNSAVHNNNFLITTLLKLFPLWYFGIAQWVSIQITFSELKQSMK